MQSTEKPNHANVTLNIAELEMYRAARERRLPDTKTVDYDRVRLTPMKPLRADDPQIEKGKIGAKSRGQLVNHALHTQLDGKVLVVNGGNRKYRRANGLRPKHTQVELALMTAQTNKLKRRADELLRPKKDPRHTHPDFHLLMQERERHPERFSRPPKEVDYDKEMRANTLGIFSDLSDMRDDGPVITGVDYGEIESRTFATLVDASKVPPEVLQVDEVLAEQVRSVRDGASEDQDG